ncbi:hypothetical protein CPB86DRAFT_147015 [Serendipita vermifera]|nr:hypothetical protein CPB86DRAFT_147015 [Serendipita vermifera]
MSVDKATLRYGHCVCIPMSQYDGPTCFTQVIGMGWTEACHVSAPNLHQQNCGSHSGDHWDDYATLFRMEQRCPKDLIQVWKMLFEANGTSESPSFSEIAHMLQGAYRGHCFRASLFARR